MSVIRARKEKVPAVVGVPVIWLVMNSMLSPGGSAFWAISRRRAARRR